MNYLAEILAALRTLHGCDAEHVGTVPVREIWRGREIWSGDVEACRLIGHAKAKRAYAWGYYADSRWEVVTVLEIPPVSSPQSAVKVAIAAH